MVKEGEVLPGEPSRVELLSEEEDAPGREFWGGSGGRKRFLKIKKGTKALKADGRWIGEAPSAAAQKIRLAKDHAAILCFGIFICSC